MLCGKCYGSGLLMGPGMIFSDCSCQYEHDMPSPSNQIQIDKRSKLYREAISKLMKENKMSKEDATKLFDEEFYKIA